MTGFRTTQMTDRATMTCLDCGAEAAAVRDDFDTPEALDKHLDSWRVEHRFACPKSNLRKP